MDPKDFIQFCGYSQAALRYKIQIEDDDDAIVMSYCSFPMIWSTIDNNVDRTQKTACMLREQLEDHLKEQVKLKKELPAFDGLKLS